MHRRKVLRLSFWMLLVLAACTMPFACWRAMQPAVGTNVRLAQCPVKGLPASATNICYALKGLFGPADYFEFDVPEADFLRWAKANGWTMTQLSEPRSFYRYTCIIQGPGEPDEVEIGHGYEYEWIDPGASDNRLHVGYDASRGRAYYERSYR